MRTKTLLLVLAIAVLCCATEASARGNGTEYASQDPAGVLRPETSGGELRGARVETLWIFWANFDDTTLVANQGWSAFDRSGTLGQDNYWHHDTIRLTETYLGESTWWCGTYDICWRQPRGYGNEWYQLLSRTMVEVAGTSPGDLVELEFDQRYAMERNYDYGYVEISEDAGATWSTLAAYNNTGFQGAGVPHNWNHPVDGHVTHDISSSAGIPIELRFRFESDIAYSSQDQYDNSQHSVKDGAWQLDNITINQNGSPIFYDDSESGNMGWVHEPREAAGQTGVTFFRGLFGDEIVTGRPFTCENREGWMYAAVDPFTKKMVDGQASWLMSPPIDVEGAPKLIGHWDYWLDMPRESGDIWNLSLAANDIYECVTDEAGFIDESPGWWYGDAGWRTRFDDWDAFAGNAWLAILCQVENDTPPEPGAQHWAGAIFNRWAVGIPAGDAGTTWDRDTWNQYNDWFIDEWNDALLDTARILIKDDDDITNAYVMASNDNGLTWEAYPMRREAAESNWWLGPPPLNQMTQGSEIHYYFEATDGEGNLATLPSGAPARYYEFSILPITATTSNPGILLVDKHGRTTPGESRYFGVYHSSEYYYREMLEVLGYEWETYDVDVPSGSVQSFGPDTMGMKYYDTQIWFFNEFNAYTLWPGDQYNLIQWLAQADAGKERNLLLTGNDHNFELAASGGETLNFLTTWLATDYVSNAVGVVTVDSVPGLTDEDGGWPFLYEEPEATGRASDRCKPRSTRGAVEGCLAGGCPVLMYFDVINARPGVTGNEIVANYCKIDESQVPAGVAYTHPTSGYQTVNLGFGMEFIQDGDCLTHAYYTPDGYFITGLPTRCFLMGRIMEYFGKIPTGGGTDVPEQGFRNMLSEAYPNPFNPLTRIAYSVREAGPVSVNVYNVAGRQVRTLLDEELEAGASGELVWNGLDDDGQKCASGVYFYRIQAPGFTASRKMVILK
jgi:hypothetical protein